MRLFNYPELKGIQTNLYKCFLCRAWSISISTGVSGLIHPEGVYDDPKGGSLRSKIYGKLRFHFQFVNVKKLFSEILHWVTYSINVYGPEKNQISFKSMSNVYVPKQIHGSLDGTVSVPTGVPGFEGR